MPRCRILAHSGQPESCIFLEWLSRDLPREPLAVAAGSPGGRNNIMSVETSHLLHRLSKEALHDWLEGALLNNEYTTGAVPTISDAMLDGIQLETTAFEVLHLLGFRFDQSSTHSDETPSPWVGLGIDPLCAGTPKTPCRCLRRRNRCRNTMKTHLVATTLKKRTTLRAMGTVSHRTRNARA